MRAPSRFLPPTNIKVCLPATTTHNEIDQVCYHICLALHNPTLCLSGIVATIVGRPFPMWLGANGYESALKLISFIGRVPCVMASRASGRPISSPRVLLCLWTQRGSWRTQRLSLRRVSATETGRPVGPVQKARSSRQNSNASEGQVSASTAARGTGAPVSPPSCRKSQSPARCTGRPLPLRPRSPVCFPHLLSLATP
jgi:hypothetical protein